MTKKILDNKKIISKKQKNNIVLITDTSNNSSTNKNTTKEPKPNAAYAESTKKNIKRNLDESAKIRSTRTKCLFAEKENKNNERKERKKRRINTDKNADNSIKESTNKSAKKITNKSTDKKKKKLNTSKNIKRITKKSNKLSIKKKKVLNRNTFIRRLKRTLSNAARLTTNSKKTVKNNLNTQKLLNRKKKTIKKKGCKSSKHKRVNDVLTRSHLVLLRNVNKTAYLNKVVKFEYLIRSLKQFMLILNLFLNYKRCHTVYLMVNTVSQKSFVTAIITKLRLKNLVFVSTSFKELYNCKGSKVVLILDGLLIQNQRSVVNAMVRSRNYLVFQMDNFPRHEYCGTYHFIADDSNVKSIIFFLLLIKRIIYKKFKICD